MVQQRQGRQLNHCIAFLNAPGDPALCWLRVLKETLTESGTQFLLSTYPIPVQRVKSLADQEVPLLLCDVARLGELQCLLMG